MTLRVICTAINTIVLIGFVAAICYHVRQMHKDQKNWQLNMIQLENILKKYKKPQNNQHLN